MFRRVFLVAFLALAGAPFVRAEAPTATAVLTSSETEVDRPVQLQIKISGDPEAIPPSGISVDGLDIRYSGQSQLVESRNFHFNYSVVFNYTILPLKAGTYTIPAQTVRSKGIDLQTEALTLNVAPNDDGSTTTRSGRGRSGSAGGSALDERKLAFAELIVPKTSAYVGEIVPVVIRLGFNSRVRPRLAEGPNLTGQGFTTQRMPQPQESIATIDGINYSVVTFKTAIAAAKSGKFEIGPVEAKALVQVPRRGGSGRGRSPFDIFGMNDPFDDPFFNDPFNGILEQRQIEIKSQTATLEVKPLPPNPPASFGGAVGIFNLTTEVKPKAAQVGDPLTVTADISGRGNFDRVTAPTLENDRGWHSYPPSANFKANDDVGLSGTKSFETVLTPNENKTAVPPLVFSYFDPLKEQYVTVKSDPIPIVIEGGVAPAPSAAIAAASVPPVAKPTPSAQADDILYQLTDQPRWVGSFAPIFLRPTFWAAQALPLLALIGFFGWKSRSRRLANREGLRRTAWEQESAELQKKLRRGEETPDEYFAGAQRVVQLKTALARRVDPNTVDAEAAVASFSLDDEKRERLRELFRRGDELRYSGRQNGHGAVNEQTRREVLALLDQLS